MQNHSNRLAKFAITLLCALGVTGCATMGNTTPLNREYTPIQGPPIRSVQSPYQPAMMCLRDHLTSEQRNASWAVGSFPDNTGRVNYTGEGTGAVVSQGLREMLTTSLGMIVDNLVDMSPDYQRQFAWATIVARRPTEYTRLPTYIVNGAMTSADFSGGGGINLRSPLNVTHREHRLNMGFDARVTTMPFDTNEAGIVLTTFRYRKQIVGVENEVGLTSFFGNTLVNLSAGQENRGFVQDSARYMMDVVAFRAVRDVTGITDCDELFYSAETSAGITRDDMPAPRRIAFAPQQPQRSTGLAQATPPATVPAITPVPQPSAAATPRTPAPASPTTTATAAPTPTPVTTTPRAPNSTPQPAAPRSTAPTDSVAAASLRTPAAYVRPATPSASVPRGEVKSQGTPSQSAPPLTTGTVSRSSLQQPAAAPRAQPTLTQGTRTQKRAVRAVHRPSRLPRAAILPSSNPRHHAVMRQPVTRTTPRAVRPRLRGRFVAISYRPCALRRCVLWSKRSRLVQTSRIQGRPAWTGNEKPYPLVLGGAYQRPSG